jgi:NAD(P)-dependent dehydrogenase (short-subunit alcohol dehydrogenase family)
MSDLNGKTVFITGATGGLGTALARRFAREGCRLFLTDLQQRSLAALLKELKSTGIEVRGESADLSIVKQTKGIIEKANQQFGSLDVLINNAGISNLKPLLELEEKDWDNILNVNVKGLFFALQAAAKCMIGKGGSIINIASVAGRLPRPKLLHYAASKAAVISITRSAALALAKDGIRVNAIAPGMIDTEMLNSLQSQDSDGSRSEGPGQPSIDAVALGRIAQPEEIADTAVFLASNQSRYIVGQTINVCGGIVMS